MDLSGQAILRKCNTHALPDILRYVAYGPFEALQTNGKGACAMHALFRNPTTSYSGCLDFGPEMHAREQ